VSRDFKSSTHQPKSNLDCVRVPRQARANQQRAGLPPELLLQSLDDLGVAQGADIAELRAVGDVSQ
jgi:hypothetical protein